MKSLKTGFWLLGSFYLFLFGGCSSGYHPMTDFFEKGWHYEAKGKDQFRISHSVPQSEADRDGLVVAAELALSRGYVAFEVIPDLQGSFGDGTEYTWDDGFDGRGGLVLFRCGKSFVIECYHVYSTAEHMLMAQPIIKGYNGSKSS